MQTEANLTPSFFATQALLALMLLAPAPMPASAGEEAGQGGAEQAAFPRVDAHVEAVLAQGRQLEASFDEPPAPRDEDWVKEKLAHMVEVDQFYRHQFIGEAVQGYTEAEREHLRQELWPYVAELDAAHVGELRELLEIYPWFTISQFGEKADHQAWLLVQHADQHVQFQERMLEILAPLAEKGETDASNYAYLYDRVATNRGRPQRFATQGRCTGPGTWEPHPLEEPERIDELRSAMDLEPLEDYIARFKEICP